MTTITIELSDEQMAVFEVINARSNANVAIAPFTEDYVQSALEGFVEREVAAEAVAATDSRIDRLRAIKSKIPEDDLATLDAFLEKLEK